MTSPKSGQQRSLLHTFMYVLKAELSKHWEMLRADVIHIHIQSLETAVQGHQRSDRQADMWLPF